MTTNPDFNYVPEDQKAIDARLDNWSRYVAVKSPSWISPIWKLGKSNGRQWAQPEFRPECNTLDGMNIERAVTLLPAPHRDALRWFYVYRYGELKFRKRSGLTSEGLMRVLRDGRQMLINRGV